MFGWIWIFILLDRFLILFFCMSCGCYNGMFFSVVVKVVFVLLILWFVMVSGGMRLIILLFNLYF